MGVIWRLIKWGTALFVLTLSGVALFSTFWPERTLDSYDQADLIMVFGGGMDADGSLHRSTSDRVKKGVALYHAGASKRLHFSGGRGRPDGPAAGERMAALAQSMGVPASAISHEDSSQSTLQNALFSLPQLGPASSVILVSEGFHLPRVVASTLWAAGPKDIQVAFSTRFRDPMTPQSTGAFGMMFREALAWWFNLGRAVLYSAGGWVGVDQTTRAEWLH